MMCYQYSSSYGQRNWHKLKTCTGVKDKLLSPVPTEVVLYVTHIVKWLQNVYLTTCVFPGL